MADRQDSSITPTDPANINVPCHIITARLVEGDITLADYTGVNALLWPSVLSTLSPAQRDEIADMVSLRLVEMKAGLR